MLLKKRFWLRVKNVVLTNVLLLTAPIWAIPLYVIMLTVAIFRRDKLGLRNGDDEEIVNICFKGDRFIFQDEYSGFAYQDRERRRYLNRLMTRLLQEELQRTAFAELVAKHGRAEAEAMMSHQDDDDDYDTII